MRLIIQLDLYGVDRDGKEVPDKQCASKLRRWAQLLLADDRHSEVDARSKDGLYAKVEIARVICAQVKEVPS